MCVSQAVSEQSTPLARFIMHGVPVVVATDNDGIMRMVEGGPFTGESVRSELWHAVLHGCLAPDVVYARVRKIDPCSDVVFEDSDQRAGVVSRRCASCVRDATDDIVDHFLFRTRDGVRELIAVMNRARFGKDLHGAATPFPSSVSAVATDRRATGTTAGVGTAAGAGAGAGQQQCQCGTCMAVIAVERFAMHEAYCARSNWRCPKCQQVRCRSVVARVTCARLS
jgi:hypothetical protein